MRLNPKSVKIPEVQKWHAKGRGPRPVKETMDRAVADGAIPHRERDVAAARLFRRKSAPCFDCSHGVRLGCEVAVDHFRVDVQRLAAAAAAAVLAGIMRCTARKQAERASAVDELDGEAALIAPPFLIIDACLLETQHAASVQPRCHVSWVILFCTR